MRLPVYVACVFVVLLTSQARAEKISDASLNRLMDLSGLTEVVESLPQTIVGGAEQARRQGQYPMSDEQFESLISIMRDAFPASRFFGLIRAEIIASVSEAEAEEMLAWYETDLGRKITRLEEEASSPAAVEDMLRREQALMLSEERVHLAEMLDDLVEGTEHALKMQSVSATALFTAFSKQRSPGKPVDLTNLNAELASSEPARREFARRLNVLYAVYAYKKLAMKDLRSYMAFMQIPATRHLYLSYRQGMLLAIEESFTEFARLLAEELDRRSGEDNAPS